MLLGSHMKPNHVNTHFPQRETCVLKKSLQIQTYFYIISISKKQDIL